MKKIITATLLCLTTALAENTNDEEFKGNWTRSFQLIEGTEIIHTPKAIIVNGLNIEKDFSTFYNFNGIPLTNPLLLKIASTHEEFVAALRKSGLYRG